MGDISGANREINIAVSLKQYNPYARRALGYVLERGPHSQSPDALISVTNIFRRKIGTRFAYLCVIYSNQNGPDANIANQFH